MRGDERVLRFSDERFSAGDERVESARSNFSLTQLHITSHFQTELVSRLLLTGTHAPSKLGGSYHAVVLTPEYATPTSYIRNSVLCWTK